jgi:predicted DNA-binding transcriptional regulator AlpA
VSAETPSAPPLTDPNPPPALLPARHVAALCGLSLATWHRRVADGSVPRSVRIGRAVRWRREELLAWIAAGCPERRTWEALQAVSAQSNGQPVVGAGRR